MYSGQAVAVVNYSVEAEDTAQAREFIVEYATEDFEGIEYDSLLFQNIEKVK